MNAKSKRVHNAVVKHTVKQLYSCGTDFCEFGSFSSIMTINRLNLSMIFHKF